MDRTLLKIRLGAGFLALLFGASCSLVVDTDECISDADCDFGDDAPLVCVSNECVPRPDDVTARQALVPATVDENLTLGGSTQWVIEGVVLVKPSASLTIEPEATLELRGDAHIVVCEGAHWSGPAAVAQLVIDENHGVCD